ncbi:hypothetical protein HYY69_03585 [Candidatus Woesearchaeota archaeon]|nr:hypothetical protein [Candidatus Woesearchaeota archaeon]
MKKLIIFSLLLLLSSSLVYAEFATVTYLGGSGDYKVEYKQTIKKGWNLLPADGTSWDISSDVPEETFLKNIKAYYLYLPLQKKYVSALGGVSEQNSPLVQMNQPYLQSSAGWYYASAPMILSYISENGGGTPQLYRGWNMLSVNPSMSTLNADVKASNHFPSGDCNVISFYLWNPEAQKWESWKELGGQSINDALDELSDPDAVGAGIVIKVKDTCQLGTTNANIGTPLGIPE